MDTIMPPQSEVATDETRNLISAGKVIGTKVYNRREEHLGSVSGLMLNKFNGQVAYAISCRSGGFLGLGESYAPSFALAHVDLERHAARRLCRRPRPERA